MVIIRTLCKTEYRVAGQVLFLAGMCPMSGSYFEPYSKLPLFLLQWLYEMLIFVTLAAHAVDSTRLKFNKRTNILLLPPLCTIYYKVPILAMWKTPPKFLPREDIIVHRLIDMIILIWTY